MTDEKKHARSLADFDPADYDEGEAPTDDDLAWYCPSCKSQGVLPDPGNCGVCGKPLACYDIRE
jgi:hypothetical protein